MKKILFLMLFASFAIMANAQLYTLRSTVGNPLDTVTNTGTKTLISKVVGDGKNVTAQFFATKLTGTLNGTAYLYGSLDGVSYGQISATTYTVTDVASQSFLWVLANHPVSYYQVRVVGIGTSTYSISASVLRR